MPTSQNNDNENISQSKNGTPEKKTIISIGCQTQSGSTQNVQVIIGHPNPENHPIQFQMRNLGDKGLTVPSNIVDSLSKIYKLSCENNAEFVDLVEYALKVHQQKLEDQKKENEQKSSETQL